MAVECKICCYHKDSPEGCSCSHGLVAIIREESQDVDLHTQNCRLHSPKGRVHCPYFECKNE